MQEKSPKVSVIMGVYNQQDEKALRACVDSILKQSLGDFEFIIWNDGSREDLTRTIYSLEEMDERIKVAGVAENRGLAVSLNECIKLARGKYIARMDCDDISLPGRLKAQVEFLDNNREYSWCGCDIELFDEEGVWGLRRMPSTPKEEDFLRFSPYAHPTVMYRSCIFNENNGYLEDKEVLRCEDYEIFLRLTKRGLKGANIDDVLFRYREDRDSFKRRTFKNRLNEAKLRYRNFKEMGMLFPFGWLFVLRPIVGGLVPGEVLRMIKRTAGKHEYELSRGDFSEEIRGVQEATAEKRA